MHDRRPTLHDSSRCPVRLRRHRSAKLGQQAGGLIQIVESTDFYWAMHVAIGDANEPHGDAFARDLNYIGIGARRSRRAAQLEGDVSGSRCRLEYFENSRTDVWPTIKHRSAPQFGFAQM